jgi:hypothetical protein
MSKNVATIILNRNLPEITDKLYNKLKKHNSSFSDFFVVEAGSDKSKLSKNYTWHATWKAAKKNGLRFARGMNYALSKLYSEGKFEKYDFFLLLTNDTIFKDYKVIKKLLKYFAEHPKLGIISPCSKSWGEYQILKKYKIKYFWFIHTNAIMIRKDFMKDVMNLSAPGFLNFFFDGRNFRGHGIESEIIAKAYINNWSAAITSDVIFDHDQQYLINNFEQIKTENYNKNLALYIEEGAKWMKKKYGFSSKWAMQMYVKNFYDNFFITNQELNKYKI